MPRRVEIEDVADALHVESTRCDVGCDENVDLARLEPVEFGDAARLVHVAMNLAAGKAVALQALVDLAHGRLPVGENDCRLDMIVCQQPAQRLALFARLHRDFERSDILVGRSRPAYLDPLGIGEELLRQLLDRRRHGGAEQQGLARLGQLGTDRLDIGDEAHVEHPVRFVDHEKLATVEQDLAPFEQVHKPARGGNQYVDTLVERLDLVAHLDAADQQGELEVMLLPVFSEILRHLRCKFARRGKNQGPGHQRAATPARQDVDHRQYEAGRLAGAGLRDPDNVFHHQNGRDGLGLDRRGLGVAGGFYRLQQLVGEAEIGKFHSGFRMWRAGAGTSAGILPYRNSPAGARAPSLKRTPMSRKCAPPRPIRRGRAGGSH